SGNMGKDTVPVGELDPEHGIGQEFDNLAFYFNSVFFRHVRISGSPLVMSTVCSKCADGFPSRVTTVHLSSSTRTPAVPMLTMGSIASVMPGFSLGPLP